jgi:hypothetical protein
VCVCVAHACVCCVVSVEKRPVIIYYGPSGSLPRGLNHIYDLSQSSLRSDNMFFFFVFFRMQEV